MRGKIKTKKELKRKPKGTGACSNGYWNAKAMSF